MVAQTIAVLNRTRIDTATVTTSGRISDDEEEEEGPFIALIILTLSSGERWEAITDSREIKAL